VTSSRASGRRVLLLCDWFLKYVGPFAEALRRAEAEVAVLCRDHAGEFGGDVRERRRVLDRMEDAGVVVIEARGRSSSVAGGARAAARARRWPADLVHAQSEIHDPRLLAAVGGRPLALMVHDPRPHLGAAPRPARLRLWQAMWQRRADYLLVHSDALAGVLGREKPVRVLPHGTAVRASPMAPPSQPAILLFGRLEYYKGVRVLLAAMERVWEQRPDVRLMIAGQGPELRVVPRDPRIEVVPGYMPEAEVDVLMSRASLVVLPYLEASQSGVGLQALGRGVPTVVTDVGGLPDIAFDESFVVPAGDSDALAEGLLRHLDHGMSLREAVLEQTRAVYGWDAVAAQALRIYDELAAARDSTRPAASAAGAR
jgi:glycosyltransferase involved in cell wall biosynthesis